MSFYFTPGSVPGDHLPQHFRDKEIPVLREKIDLLMTTHLDNGNDINTGIIVSSFFPLYHTSIQSLNSKLKSK